MKTKIMFILLIISGQLLFSQECTNKGGVSTIKIVVDKVVEYGIEYPPFDPEHYLLITETKYKSELQNIWPNKSSKSFGKITDCDFWATEDLSYGKLTFKWHYENSYDNKKGTALVQIDININETRKFANAYVTIIGENNDFLLNYKGKIIKD